MSTRMRTAISTLAPVGALLLSGLVAGLVTSPTPQPLQDSDQERVDPIRLLINQIDELNEEIMVLRKQAADAETLRLDPRQGSERRGARLALHHRVHRKLVLSDSA